MPDATPALSKRHHVTIASISAIAGIAGSVLAFCGAVLTPFAVNFIRGAVASDIQTQVVRHISPTNAAFKVLIESQVAQLEDDIGQLLWRQTNQPRTWTELDQQKLVSKQRQLRSQQDALRQIASASR